MFDVFFALMHFVFICLQKCAPSLSQKHIFENQLWAISLQNTFLWSFECSNGGSVGHLFCIYRSFGPSARLFSPSVAHQNFNFRWEKCLFPVYEPSWKPPFNINCSIECIFDDLFKFSDWLVLILCWFCKFYENVLPARGGKHTFEERFLPVSCARRCFHTQAAFKTTTFGEAFPPCALQKILCISDWVDNGPIWKPCLASLLFSHAF